METPMTLEAVRSVPMFAALTDDEARGLLNLLEFREAPAGTALFRFGDRGDAMYFIEGGSVRIHVPDTDGKEVTLAEFSRGDFLGEIAVLSGKPRSATATVIEHLTYGMLRSVDFLAFVRKNPEVALEIARASSERLQRTDELLRERVSRNANEEDAAKLTFADKMADAIAAFGGSWRFIFGSLLFFLLWMLLNTFLLLNKAFDPFPYILLNLLLGVMTALQAPIIMMSQNRQSEKDRLRADLDYRVNLKNELALTEVLCRIDVLESERLPDLFEKQAKHLASIIKMPG